MALLARYFHARQLGTDWSGLKEAGTEHMINALSMLLPLGLRRQTGAAGGALAGDAARNAGDPAGIRAALGGGGNEVMQ